MPKFKMRLKLQGFELEMEGDRSDIPVMTQNVGQQLAGMLQPAAQIAVVDQPDPAITEPFIEIKAIPPSRKRSRRSGTGTATDAKSQPINWQHDPAKWGSPKQTWGAGTKALWLLYVLVEAGQPNELTASQLATTFNRAFKEARTIPASNVMRDFRNFKPKGFVGEDTSVTPSRWNLLDKGKLEAQKLIREAQGKKNPED